MGVFSRICANFFHSVSLRILQGGKIAISPRFSPQQIAICSICIFAS
jgi:hypothetical protein